MITKIYLAYRIWLYIITVYLSGKYSLKCNRSIMRIIILGTGIIMILMNKAIAAFLAPILVILVATAVIVLIALAIIGHLLGTIVQRFNRIHKK